tara:strand:- start:298 stop:2088 length:1791 start_codon:yes stop_codon:yes gene_type:complete
MALTKTQLIKDLAIKNADIASDAAINSSKITLTTVDKNAESGIVKFVRTSVSSGNTDPDTWEIITPDGTTVDISGTTTQGLQEAIDYAVNNGFDFFCHGGGIANRPVSDALGEVYRVSVPTANAGSGLTNATSSGTPLTGGSGTGLTVNITRSGGAVTGVSVNNKGSGYQNNDIVTLPANTFGTHGALQWYASTSSDVGVIQATKITIPPTQLRSFTFKSITLLITPTNTADAGLTFNSGMMLDFDFRGQIGYTGNGNAVEINPTDRHPYDVLAAGSGVTSAGQMVDSNIRIDTIAYIGHGSGFANDANSCFCIQTSCLRNTFTFGELNGSGYTSTDGTVTVRCGTGVLLHNKVINDNLFNIGSIHHHAKAGVQIGTSTDASAGIPLGNDFRIGLIELKEGAFPQTTDSVSTANAIDSFGSYNRYVFSATNGAGDFETGYYGQSSAAKETVIIRKCSGNTNAAEYINVNTNPQSFIWNGQEGFTETGNTKVKKLILDIGPELTIASGVITVTHSFHSVDTEGDAGTDDLVTINGGVAGQMLTLRAINDGRTIVLKDSTGNLRLNADRSLDHSRDSITLIYVDDSMGWVESTFTTND